MASGLDVAGDILGLIFYRSNFLLAIILNTGIPAGLAPLVYLYGAKGASVSGSLVHSHWSRNVEARLSLVESFPSDACASSLMP